LPGEERVANLILAASWLSFTGSINGS
jgi:hypothetical protein